MKSKEKIEQLAIIDLYDRQKLGHYELADLKSIDYYYDGFTNGYTKCQEDLNKDLYSEIENLIIIWCSDGTKTVKTLTKQIMELLNK